MELGTPLVKSEAPNEARMVPTISVSFVKNPAFRSWWKVVSGFVVAGATGVMSWKNAGVAALLATLPVVWDLFTQPDQIQEVK